MHYVQTGHITASSFLFLDVELVGVTMNWNRINIWTNTLYTLVHSLNISKKIAFGNLTTIDQGIDDARQWISPECSYESVLLVHPFGGAKITFRRDPNHHFEEIATQLIKMLIQDLVVIFDEMMLEVLIARGQHPAVFPPVKN
jgi:hypothetical protein